jgi:hypothetical protein
MVFTTNIHQLNGCLKPYQRLKIENVEFMAIVLLAFGE